MKRDNSMTRRFLAEAGIAPGMRVLEVGCGPGEVTRVLAELLGPSGAIVAVDRDEQSLGKARERLAEPGLAQTRFIAADISGALTALDELKDPPFDALVGRRVLMYLPDPAAALRRLGAWLRDGGLVVFEEADATMTPARRSPLPAHDQASAWLEAMLEAEGANPAMGFELPAVLARAGFRFEKLRAEAVFLGQGTQFPYSALVPMLQHRLVSSGIASAEEIEALLPLLDAEDRDPTRVYATAMSFCARARKG